MAQHVEPMDIDSSVCDFDDKENAFHHNNARTPCTEKGYEELDVSELNMKLRYSVTPAASPMSKSYAGNFDNRSCETDNTLEAENGNMTRSLHTTLTKNDTIVKTHKTLPLQSLPTDLAQVGDGNRNVLQPLDSTITVDNNVTVTLTGSNDIDDNISLPSSSSSMAHTPEATTPTKEIPKGEPASPIIRGLKSVLNMFRPSQSPIPGEDAKLETLSPPIVHSPETRDERNDIVTASTPLVGHINKDSLTKRNSPPKESIVFNENLENELEWKDDSTIIFSNEKIPIHKLFFQLPKSSDTKRTLDLSKAETNEPKIVNEGPNMDASVEYMDISYNDSGIMDKTATSTKTLSELNKSGVAYTESDSEFVDCESTFTKNDSFKSQTLDSTEDVLAHIDDLVETRKDNASSETLNASDAKSANLSTASIETAKQNDSRLTIANITQEEKIKEEIQAEEEIIESIPSVSDEIDVVHPNNLVNEFVNDPVTVHSNIQINETIVVHSPILENVGVKSLSQIPLLADPRILLFNIPPVANDNKKDEVSNDGLKALPADIPLPEDDDIPSLPGMNSELENLSHALDKIAEEIPKINQHDSSVSAVGSLSDNKSNEIPLPENIDPAEFVESSGKDICANKQHLNVINNEAKVEYEGESVEYKQAPANCFSENETELNALTATNPEYNHMPINVTEIQAVAENILTTICEDVNIQYNTITPISENQSEESVLPSAVSNNVDIHGFVSDKSCSAIDMKVENPEQIIVSDSALGPLEVNLAVPEAKSDILSKIMIQDVEPMDVSVAELPVVTEFDEKQQVSKENVAFFSTEENINELVTSKENEYPKTKFPSLSNEINLTPDYNFSSNTPVTTIVTPTNSDAIQNDIDFIKQEVDVIVAKAIDIATEKYNAKKSFDIVNNKIKKENNDESALLPETKTADMEKNTSMSVEQVKDKINFINDSLEHTESSKVSNETDVMSSEEEADKQEKSLNRLCANKYSYTVQDNIPATISNHNADSAEAKNYTFCATESLLVPSDATIDVSNVENNAKSANEEKEIQIQSNPTNQGESLLDVTPPDMVKIEPIVTTDEEIIISENNSPFVSVSHEIDYPVEVTLSKNIHETENIFVSKSITNSPPISPKIVSKGYNFNFDEIDDPFATKTKIRISPAQDATENQTIEQNFIAEQETLKEESNKNYRRRSQPGRKKPAVNNKKINATFSGVSVYGSKPGTSAPEAISSQCSEKEKAIFKSELPKSIDKNTAIQNVTTNDCKTDNNKIPGESNPPADSNIINVTSSSEQSIYLSAGASSDEALQVQTEIKVPNLENSAFNPFASNSKVQQSPPPENERSPFATRTRICQTPPLLETDDLFAIKSKIKASPENTLAITKDDVNASEFPSNTNKDTIEFSVDNKPINIGSEKETMHSENSMKLDIPEEKESKENISGATSSSNNDKDSTVREINTEDEDTVEGPFLEADDLQNYDKMSDFEDENVDMMQFSESLRGNQENPDAGELFIDAEAFEFLLNQNANTISDSGKESLFLKFDPLFAKRLSSDGVLAALKHGQTQVKQSTPIKNKRPPIPRDVTFHKSSPLEGPSIPKNATFDRSSPLAGPPIPRDATFDKASPLTRLPISRDATFDQTSPLVAPSVGNDATFDKSSPLAGPSGINTTQEIDLNSTAEDSYDDLNVTVAKPMMVVNPAVNPVVTPRNKTITPVRSNRHSLTFTSPAIAVIDRLLSMSAANNSLMAHDTTVAEIPRDNDADLALTQLRELLADKEISVYNLRSETKELQNRLASLESQMKNLEMISEDRLKKINDLNEKLNEKAQINKQMAKVVEEYERTIASLIDETAQDKKRHAEERHQLIKERDEQTAHLASMEVSFNDLHSKYEKSKQIIIGFKANEDAYKKSIKEFEENLAKMHKNYELLKQHATSKLNHANEELQKINRTHEAEVLKMNAMIKRKELHITSLEETLQQKTKANEELTAICDELINKVG